MKNEKLFAMIGGSSTVKTPDVLPRLTFDAAEKYKNTVTPKSPVRSYIKAAVIYAAACVVLLIAIPFIIGNVTDTPKPSGPVTEQTKLPITDAKEPPLNDEPQDEYRLAIEDEIMESPGALQIDEFDLDKYPYTDISAQYPEYDNAVYFPVRVPNNNNDTMPYDYGTIELFYTENSEKKIDIKVTEESYSAGEVKDVAEITIRLDKCTMIVRVWTDGTNPIVLPPEVEQVLRYILNMPYKLAIEDELLGATSSKSEDELISYGYEEITHGGSTFLMREFECETGEIDFRVYYDMQGEESPFANAFDYPVPEVEEGKLRIIADIWAADCFIKMRVTVEDAFPIVLPESAEKELRYILNIEKEDAVTTPPETTSIQTVPKPTTPPETTPAVTEPPEPVITYPTPSITKRTATSITKSLYGCEYTISVDKAGYKTGDIVTVKVTLENKGDGELYFSSGSGRSYLKNYHFYHNGTKMQDSHTEIFDYPDVVTEDVLKKGDKWESTKKFCTCECDPFAKWSIIGTIRFAINGEAKTESLEFDLYHALPDTYNESYPYNKLPAITDFSSTAFEKRTNPFADIESAVLYKNGAALPLKANDPMLVRLLNFMTYSDEEPIQSHYIIGGFYDVEDYEYATSRDYRLEIKFTNTSDDLNGYISLCRFDRAIITEDTVYVVMTPAEPQPDHIGWIDEYSVICTGWFPYARHFSRTDISLDLLTYAGFWNYGGK